MSSGLLAGVLVLSVGAPPASAGEVTPPGRADVSEAHKDALARYGAAVWQARRDRLLSAVKALEAAAKQDPDATAPLKELVRIYSQVGREPDAIRVARVVLEKTPNDVDTAHTLARLLYDAGDLTEAVDLTRRAADAIDPIDRPGKALAVYRDLATLLDKAGNPAGAAAALRKAATLLTEQRKVVAASGEISPKGIDAAAADTFERLGRALVKAGQPAAAVDAFQAAHKLYADPAGANDPAAAARLDWNLSAAYAAKGDPTAALARLEAFLKLRPQAVEPYERFAALMKEVGRSHATVAGLRRYADLDPKNLPLVAVLAAELAHDADTRPLAEAAFARLEPAATDPAVVRVVVRSHVETGRAVLVIADLDQAYLAVRDASTKAGDVAADEKRAVAAEKARTLAAVLGNEPEWAAAILRAAAADLRAGAKRRTHQTWQTLSVLAARHHKLDLAAEQLEEAVRLAPRETPAEKEAQGEAYGQLISILWRCRKPDKVAAVCRNGLRSTDLSPAYFNSNLAFALAELGDGLEAVAAVDKAISQAGDFDRLGVRLQKVLVLRVLGRMDDAAGLCRKLLDEFDAPAERTRIRYTLSTVYWAAKKYAEAEAELRAVLEADPDHAGANNDLGYHLADQGRNLDEAERLVRHAVEVDRADRRKAGDPESDNASYLDSLAWVLFRQEKLADAAGLLEKAVRSPEGESHAEIWDHLGDVRFRLGDKVKAKAAWDRAANLYAADPQGKRDGRLDEVKRKQKRIP